MVNLISISIIGVLLGPSSKAFAPSCIHRNKQAITLSSHAPVAAADEERIAQKKALLGLLGGKSEDCKGYVDPVLTDPDTKEAIRFCIDDSSKSSTVILGGSDSKNKDVKIIMRSSTHEYQGTSTTFLNLLEPVDKPNDNQNEDDTESKAPDITDAFNKLLPFVPPPLRSVFSSGDNKYIPMRDLFTSPAVSFAYERGWRQGFARAGFPGPDLEFQMAQDYFRPAVVMTNYSTIVDMSCATGLFTRRFAKSDEYSRVLGCDYSESMLTEARRRIRADASLQSKRLDLVRCDVGRIPMQSNSIDALHAGAAMHCWPDLSAATKEIYRVLKPKGRYFATTFLSSYFSTLQLGDSNDGMEPSQMAFQYFASVDQLRNLMIEAGFDSDKVQVEVLGPACVVIRCEK